MTYSDKQDKDFISDNDEYYRELADRGLRLHGLIVLIAIEIIMSFSIFGYVRVPPISVSFVYIPVVVAACFMGTREAVIVGVVAGLACMFKSSAHFVQPLDQLFSPFLSGNPAGSIVIGALSRIVFALLIGFLYNAARKSAHPFTGMIAVTLCAKTINSFIIMLSVQICFPESGLGVMNTVRNFFTPVNFLGMATLCIVVLLCFVFLHSKYWLRFTENVRSAYELRLSVRHHRSFYFLMTVSVLILSMALSVYLMEKLDNMYYNVGFDLPRYMLIDQTVLYIQFVAGMTSITALFGVALRLYYLNQSYITHDLMTDDVTHLLNRKNFFKRCEAKLKSAELQNGDVGFMIIDADYFKTINDTYGHMEGDRVLRKMADALRLSFSDIGILGRLGGDEFAVFLYMQTDKDSIKKRLDTLYEKVRSIKCGDLKVSCSTGAVIKKMSVTTNILYKTADEMLYMAKERGKNRYVLSAN